MPGKLWLEAHRGVGRKKTSIILAQELSGWSAADVARIAFDPVAWHAAQLVGNSLSVAKISCLPLYPKAHFLFDGKTTLRASGVWLPFGDDPVGTFLVYQLLSCSHRFPFRELEYKLAGRIGFTSASPQKASEKSERSSIHDDVHSKSIPVPAKRTNKNMVEEDPSKNLGLAELVIEKESQFPDLRFKSVRRITEPSTPEIQIQLLPGERVSSASVGSDGKLGDVRPVDLVRHSEWGKCGVESHQLMRDLVAELSASAKFDKIEIICVKPEEEDSILASFSNTIRRFNGGAWDRPLRKRLPAFSNIQIALATKGGVIIFLLISEINRQSKLSPLCIAIKPHSYNSSWSIAEDIVVALSLPILPDSKIMIDYDILPHFLPVPRMTLKLLICSDKALGYSE